MPEEKKNTRAVVVDGQQLSEDLKYIQDMAEKAAEMAKAWRLELEGHRRRRSLKGFYEYGEQSKDNKLKDGMIGLSRKEEK